MFRFQFYIWNIRNQTINKLYLTNNFSEGWNNSFNKSVRLANAI